MLRNPLYVYSDRGLTVPPHLNVGQFLVETLWKHGDIVALINGKTHEKLTYREIVKDAMNISISLARLGVKKGDAIAICSENRQEYWGAFIGILCTGATTTTTNMAYTKDELSHVLSISKPKMIFCSPLAYRDHEITLKGLSFIKKIIIYGKERPPNTMLYVDLAKIMPDICEENFVAADVMGQTDTAVILYSSGTTGLPKGVMLSHLNVITTCNLPNAMNTNELTLTITPWYHTMGLMGTLRSFTSGCTMVYLPKFDSETYLQTIERYRIYQLMLAPPVLIALYKTRTNHDVSTVNIVFSAAAPLRDDTAKAVKERFPNARNVLQGYGMTETTLAVTRDTYDAAHLSKVGGVGYIVPGIVIKVVDTETGKILGPNQPGEICAKGPMIMLGYIGKDKREDIDDEGFFKTGDIGYYDNDKCFFIVDRLKELIKYKGYQVPPAEIEAVLVQHPGIRDAGVVGVPHESGGEVPRAYIVASPDSNLSENDVNSFVAEKLSNPKHLRGGVEFVKEIPKNPSGKILRKKLRELAKREDKTKSKL